MNRFKSLTITYISEVFFGGRPPFFGDEFVDCLFGEEFFDCLFGNVCTSDFLGLPRFLPDYKIELMILSSTAQLHKSKSEKKNSEWEQCLISRVSSKSTAFFYIIYWITSMDQDQEKWQAFIFGPSPNWSHISNGKMSTGGHLPTWFAPNSMSYIRGLFVTCRRDQTRCNSDLYTFKQRT